MKDNLLRNVVENLILSMGPVCFDTVRAEVKTQVSDKIEDWEIVQVLNKLLHSSKISLYDDGQSFTA